MEKPPEEEAASTREDIGGEGGQLQAAGAAEASEEDHTTLLLRLREQTKQQLLEYKSMVDANEEETPEEILQEEQIEAKIEGLENEIQDAKTAFEVKTLMLHRLKLSALLENNLENIDTKMSLFIDNMKHILKLNKSITASQQESWDLEEKLLAVRKKRLQLKQASASKLLEMQTERNKQKNILESMENSGMLKDVRQSLQKEIQITTVVQHVFQNLILGSKVNWAEIPALKEIVLNLEKNLTMI
ncbi:centromere protein H isoform X2 [Echinops telfairi]|uniref:Centromere protein H isoform X2 n=1 Tax=Echinops telfairi TaxID=9371 RepID=A0AC55CLH8_ECHTE|nr:centromere protein H isoform X2 [Echinops telfairi]